MDKERKETLNWLVQLTNMNLDEIKPGDKAKLLVESEEHLFAPMWKGGLDKKNPLVMKIASEMPWAFKPLPPRESGQYWASIKNAQRTIRQEIERLIHERAEGIDMEIGIERAFVLESIKGKIQRTYIPITKTFEGYLTIRFHLLLEGLLGSAIQKCPGCGKYFLNPTFREKNFCSPRCMWRVNAEKKRENLKRHPERYKAYLKKQRETMKKRYREKVILGSHPSKKSRPASS